MASQVPRETEDGGRTRPGTGDGTARDRGQNGRGPGTERPGTGDGKVGQRWYGVAGPGEKRGPGTDQARDWGRNGRRPGTERWTRDDMASRVPGETEDRGRTRPGTGDGPGQGLGTERPVTGDGKVDQGRYVVVGPGGKLRTGDGTARDQGRKGRGPETEHAKDQGRTTPGTRNRSHQEPETDHTRNQKRKEKNRPQEEPVS